MGRARDRSARRRRWPWVLALLALLAMGAAADAVWAGMHARAALLDVRASLSEGGAALEDGDLARARTAFGEAAELAGDAAAWLDHPGISVVGAIPTLGDDVEAARILAGAAGLSARAGTDLSDGADAAGWNGEDIPGFAPGGRIEPGVFTSAAPHLRSAADGLARAAEDVGAIQRTELVDPVRGAVAGVVDELDDRASQAATVADAAQALPGLLGADGPRTYLLVMFNPSDPRGSGGYPGGYGVLHADGTELRLGDIEPTHAIPKVPRVDASADTARRWDLYGSRTTFWNTTYVPDFPTAASLMVGIWEAGGGEPVDGVIGGDPAFLSGLLDAVGPVDTRAWPDPITGGTVERILGVETFRTTSQEASDAWQVGIGGAAWQALLERRWPAERMATALGDGVEGRHLLAYSVRDDEQAALSRIGVAGEVAFPPAPAPLIVPLGSTPNRAGALARFDTSVTTEPAGDGTRVTATVTLENDAPVDCPPSLLCGLTQRGIGGPLGTFGAWIHVYLPVGAREVRIEIDGRRWSWPIEREFGRPVTVSSLTARPQERSTTVITYRVPDGKDDADA